MEKCKFTKKYFNNQVVMFRYSCNDHVVEKFYHIEDDHEIHEGGKDTYHPIFTIIYEFIRDKNNQKNYWYAKATTTFGEDEMVNMFTTRLDKIRNRVLKQLWEKSAMITMATGYILDKKEITDE